jgi:hypothetical protein
MAVSEVFLPFARSHAHKRNILPVLFDNIRSILTIFVTVPVMIIVAAPIVIALFPTVMFVCAHDDWCDQGRGHTHPSENQKMFHAVALLEERWQVASQWCALKGKSFAPSLRIRRSTTGGQVTTLGHLLSPRRAAGLEALLQRDGQPCARLLHRLQYPEQQLLLNAEKFVIVSGLHVGVGLDIQ